MRNKPKMIFFDYGHTLLYEPGFDFLRGEEALFKYVKSNKNGLTPKEVFTYSQELYAKISAVREIGYELHEWQFQRFLYEYLEIELSVSLPEAEKIFWNSVSAGEVMPNAGKMLDYINANGIRSGVISNIGFSGAALTERINRLLPRNKFEFIIASSEYMFRKPSVLLFELALKKAGLNAADVWFCGDSVKADVEGASCAGIFPVWYDNETVENPRREQNKGIKPQCEHLHIHDWAEMIDVLSALNN
ncbi:MAG: HAD family hydrolase [Clostridiales bacterium]|nr:HAD family hydrolase [Clostridiales bacterium]